jgi:hypothetical protein
MEQFWFDAAGWLGSILVVAAYALNMGGRLRADAPFYLWANIIGSIGLILNTAYVGAYPSAVVNTIWVMIGLWGVVRSRRKIVSQ